MSQSYLRQLSLDHWTPIHQVFNNQRDQLRDPKGVNMFRDRGFDARSLVSKLSLMLRIFVLLGLAFLLLSLFVPSIGEAALFDLVFQNLR